MKRALALVGCLLLGNVLAQPAPAPPSAVPSLPRESFIERVPLPNEALPPDQQLKEFPKPEVAPPAPPTPVQRIVTPLAETANNIMGLGVKIFVLTMVGLLLTCVIVFALARMVLRRTVRQVATGLPLPAGDEGTENEHHAEALADAAAEDGGVPAAPLYHALPALGPDEAAFHRRLTAAVPELSVHPKVALASLLAHSGEADWEQIARLPLDFVVLRRDGAVIAVVLLDNAVIAADERERMAVALDTAGYRVLRFADDAAPDHDALRAQLLAPPVLKATSPAPAAGSGAASDNDGVVAPATVREASASSSEG